MRAYFRPDCGAAAILNTSVPVRQVVRRGLKEIIVDTVPDPTVAPHHVVVRTHHSLISAGTETASIHTGSVLGSVVDNPSHLRTVWNAMQSAGPTRTIDEVRAKFRDYAVLDTPAPV